MNKLLPPNNRRNFIKQCGLSTLPLLLPTNSSYRKSLVELNKPKDPVNFMFDGLLLAPNEYLAKLQEISNSREIEPDFYGNGGAVKALEEKFAAMTGKEKAIYLPTGTMANQLAIKLLNGSNTKVIVPENSHIFRDEADAAQSVHNKRLIPVGKDKAFFELTDLQNTLSYLNDGEVFKSGLGTIVIENPVRRADGTFVPIDTLKEITDFCRQEGYKLHLDGARIHIASAYAKVSVKAYASHFDTVYISLYKYLNAAGGAILCGEASLIDQISHQIKILGGTVFQNWVNAAMALHYLEGIDERWKQVVSTGAKLIAALNSINGISIKNIPNGTNIHHMQLSEAIDLKKLANYLYNEYSIWVGRADNEGIVKFTINESILTRTFEEILLPWEKGIKQARK